MLESIDNITNNFIRIFCNNVKQQANKEKKDQNVILLMNKTCFFWKILTYLNYNAILNLK